MTSDQPTVWRDDMEAQDRVRAVAKMLTQPRSASWIAHQAQVNYKTAQKYLNKLTEENQLLTTQRGRETRYYPNQRVAFLQEIDDLVDTHTKHELTDELNAIAARIEHWQGTYGVDDSDELRTTLDESRSLEDRRERERAIDTWEYNDAMRTLIRHAIRLYDDLHRLTREHSQDPTAAANK